MYWFYLLAVPSLFSLVPLCGAQSRLTLADCQRLAESAPSLVTASLAQSRIAQAGVSIARSGFLPQSNLSSGYTYNSPLAGQGSFVALNGVREYQSLAATSIEIDTSGRLRAALARARADRDIAAVNIMLTRRDLRRNVANAYYRVLLARHLTEAAEASLAEATSFRQRAQALFTGGEVARADVVKADSQVAFLQQALTAAQLDAQLANQDLASYWTANVDVALDLEDTLTKPEPPEGAPVPSLYMRRPEMDLLQAERRGFEADYRRERAALFPQLGVVYQYGLDTPRLAASERGSATFLTLNFPIFDWFRIRNLARQFAIQAEQVDTNRAISTRVFSRDYSAAGVRIRLLWEQISSTQTQVQTSDENLRLARTRYEGGEGPALDVVAAQQQLQQARVNYFTALSNYANAKADLGVASGQ